MNTNYNIINKESDYFLLINVPELDFKDFPENENLLVFNLGTSAMTAEYKLLDESSSKYSEYIIPIKDLDNLKYKLKNPLDITFKVEDDNMIGEISELDIYAFGEKESDIIEEIKEDVVDLYEELEHLSKGQLGTLPTKWKNILSQKIQTRVD